MQTLTINIPDPVVLVRATHSQALNRLILKGLWEVSERQLQTQARKVFRPVQAESKAMLVSQGVNHTIFLTGKQLRCHMDLDTSESSIQISREQ